MAAICSPGLHFWGPFLAIWGSAVQGLREADEAREGQVLRARRGGGPLLASCLGQVGGLEKGAPGLLPEPSLPNLAQEEAKRGFPATSASVVVPQPWHAGLPRLSLVLHSGFSPFSSV